MATAQVSSETAKKEELREAGRRRLEEFRKKKGAKKSAASSQPRISNSTTAEKQTSQHEPPPPPLNSVGLGYAMTGVVTDSSGDIKKDHGFAHDSGSETVPQEQVNSGIGNWNSSNLLSVLPAQAGNGNDAPVLEYQKGSVYVKTSELPSFENDVGNGKHEVAVSLGSNSNFSSNFYGGDKDTNSSLILPFTNDSAKNFGRFTNLLQRHDEPESMQPNIKSQASTLEVGYNQQKLALKNDLTSDNDERRPSDVVESYLKFGSQQASESLSESWNFNSSGPVNGILSSAAAETHFRKSRPSFLDSLKIGNDSPVSGRPLVEKGSFTTSKLPSNDFVAPSRVPEITTFSPAEPLPTPVYSNTNSNYFGNGFMGQKILENSLDSKLQFNSERQNEDFAALEQHIEDLTQEKFSLQRSMEASKALAESLAAENSSLTESYNQQASLVSQLKAEIGRLQEEIKARSVELEAIKAEFTNAHLECNAADERAKLLASEVINLEEKALRLRSSELKLERELENSNAEITSYKKKMSSLDKDRRDMQQTIDALQEEKKLLQSKLRKTSTSGTSVDLNRVHSKKDVSTSTADLQNTSEQASSNIQTHNNADNLLSLLENRSASFEDLSTIIPPDQVQVIQNINSLISEIMVEKEEVTQALKSEVSTCAKLKDMNKELSRKLEVQTQRLELLTAQSMASDNPPPRQPMGSRIARETIAYADEGDEVVERVLGWIMKLFPGGPSKRRTSRL
ncbi:hypothetical protein KSS87_017193 [Heliosperma pusillum]|nr:hypothetical protein KSS87_017193 [Heliosperma pusillum]